MKMLHITIQTSKFDSEIKFYEEYIGLFITKDLRPMGKNIVFLTDGEENTNIEIIEKSGADNSGNENLSIGFREDNLELKREELISAGFEVTPMICPMVDVRFFFVKDPAGVLVQLM